MKIIPEHYETLRKGISDKYRDLLINHAVDFNKYLSGHTDKRIAWDLLNAAKLMPFVCNTLYKYCNDSHIDTALLRIIKEIKTYHNIINRETKQ